MSPNDAKCPKCAQKNAEIKALEDEMKRSKSNFEERKRVLKYKIEEAFDRTREVISLKLDAKEREEEEFFRNRGY